MLVSRPLRRPPCSGAPTRTRPRAPHQTLERSHLEDLRAIFAYLQSLPAIKNPVPNAQVPDAVIAGIATTYEKIAGAPKTM